MPKRSNAFQNLLHVIYRQLAGDAIVTESRMLIDRVTGEQREVDIVVESNLASHGITIGVECMAKNRRACVEWVERMRGKHKDLPTDKLILVSQSGFYKTALRKAQFYRIETMSLGDAMKTDWTKTVRRSSEMTFEYYDNKAIYSLYLRGSDNEIFACGPPNEWVVSFDDGTEATINQFVNTIIASDEVRANVLRILDAGGGPRILIQYARERAWSIRDEGGSSREIVGLQITLETGKETTSITLKHGSMCGYQVSFGEGKYSRGMVSFANLESEVGPGISAIRWPTGELQVSDLKRHHGPEEIP